MMTLAVLDKFTGETMAELPSAGPGEVRTAVSRAEAAFPAWAETPAHRRSAILAGVAARRGCTIAARRWRRSSARCVMSAFANAGQVCISLQRLYLHEQIVAPFLERFLAATAALKVGNRSIATATSAR